MRNLNKQTEIAEVFASLPVRTLPQNSAEPAHRSSNRFTLSPPFIIVFPVLTSCSTTRSLNAPKSSPCSFRLPHSSDFIAFNRTKSKFDYQPNQTKTLIDLLTFSIHFSLPSSLPNRFVRFCFVLSRKTPIVPFQATKPNIQRHNRQVVHRRLPLLLSSLSLASQLVSLHTVRHTKRGKSGLLNPVFNPCSSLQGRRFLHFCVRISIPTSPV
jgi:hypothetical protein